MHFHTTSTNYKNLDKQKMKKALLTMAIIFGLSLNSNSQNIDLSKTPTNERSVELKLQKFRSQSLSGFWLTIIGAGVVYAGSTISADDRGKQKPIKTPVIGTGIILMGTGTILKLSAFKNLK